MEELKREIENLREQVKSIQQRLTDRELPPYTQADLELKNRLILKAAYDAFISIDSAGTIIDWNPQAEKTFGWSAGEAIGQQLVDTIIPESYKKAHLEGLKDYLLTGKGPVLNKRMEMTALRRAGEEFPIEIAIFPIILGQEHTFGAFIHDISDRKRSEEREKQLSLMKQRDEFVTTLTHDLKTPLSTAIRLIEFLEAETGGSITEKQKELLQYAWRCNREALSRIRNLLEVTRRDSDYEKLNLNDEDLCELVRNCMEKWQPIASICGVKLDSHIAENPVPVRVDKQAFTRIMENLVDNALHHTPKEGQITIVLTTQDRTASIEVRDTGPGISKHVEPDLFKRFVITGEQDSRSTGLGLYLTKQLVEEHQGTIEYETRSGKGTTFKFELPLNL